MTDPGKHCGKHKSNISWCNTEEKRNHDGVKIWEYQERNNPFEIQIDLRLFHSMCMCVCVCVCVCVVGSSRLWTE